MNAYEAATADRQAKRTRGGERKAEPKATTVNVLPGVKTSSVGPRQQESSPQREANADANIERMGKSVT
jgi:hypothetical protein